MVCIFTITQINYLMISYSTILRDPVCIYICGIKFFDCAICLVFGTATKTALSLPKYIPHIVVSAHHTNLFSNKIFYLNSVLQIVRFVVLL